MTLRSRLALGLMAIAVLLIAPLLIARRSLEHFDRTMNGLKRGEFTASLLLGRMRGKTEDLRRAELSLFGSRDSTSLPVFYGEFAQLSATIDSLRRVSLDSAALQMHELLRNVPALAQAEFAAVVVGDTVAADSVSGLLGAVITNADGQITAAERALAGRVQLMVDQAAEQSADARRAAVSALALAAVLATMIGVWLVRSISDPVRDLERGMDAVAGGEFRYRLTVRADRDDEFGRLASSYHMMSAQLAQLDRLKSEFVSVASHELKTPINVIGGYLQLLDEGVYGPLNARQTEVFATLSAQCDSLARLVRQLLDVSRFEAGGGKIEPRRMALGAFLDDLERAFHVLAMQRDVVFRVTSTMGLPHEVTWDADRINEVLGNMLSNAFKFTPRGGLVELRAEPDDRGVQLTVRDTGAGIPPAQLPHIFKKFFQADNQASASAKGTGLGLAISRRIIDAHGGSVSVDSTPGVGTMFTIVLPEHVRSGHRLWTRQQRATIGVGA